MKKTDSAKIKQTEAVLKVLMLHNYYGSSAPSGENAVFEAECELLRTAGHEVTEFTRNSDEVRTKGFLGAVQGGLVTPWNPWMYRAVQQVAESIHPDVVHAHNTFPLISPAIFHAIGGRAARLITLHNCRLFCSAAILAREDKACTKCLDRKSAWPAIQHGCYRNSRLATVPLAASIALHRKIGTWGTQVEAFITLSNFQRELMCTAGLPRERVWVKPNFFPGRPAVVPWLTRGKRAVFVGRLSLEKGVSNLVTAWLAWGAAAPELVVVGDGPLRETLETRVLKAGSTNIRFVGQVPAEEAQRWIASSRLLILPSRWFEGFPMVLCEAFAFGTPSIVSDTGTLPELVANSEAGAVFRAGDEGHLREVASALWNDESGLARMAERARQQFESKYTEEANYQQLMNIYDKAIALRHANAGKKQ